MVDPQWTDWLTNMACHALQVKNGVDVILLGGSTAEWPSLTPQERLDLLQAWRAAIDALPDHDEYGTVCTELSTQTVFEYTQTDVLT